MELMDPVREALRSWLGGDPTLTAALSAPQAIFFQTAERTAKPPYVLFDQSAGTTRKTMGDGHAGTNEVWLVKAVDRNTTPTRAEDIDRLIAERLDCANLVIDGKPAQAVERESRIRYGEGDGAERFHHVGATYRIGVQPAT